MRCFMLKNKFLLISVRRAISVALATTSPLLMAASLTAVPFTNPKLVGESSPNVLSPELIEATVATGSTRVENPTTLTDYYGYNNDGTLLPAPGALPSTGSKVEATKTEPDKNTYLVMRGLKG